MCIVCTFFFSHASKIFFLEGKKNKNEECVVFIKEFKFGVFNLLACILMFFLFGCVIDFRHMEQSNLRSNNTVHTICSL